MTDFSPAELSSVWEVAAAGAALVVHPDESHWAELVSAVARVGCDAQGTDRHCRTGNAGKGGAGMSTEPEVRTIAQTFDGVWGIWVSFHDRSSGYPCDKFAVHINELAARRFAMAHHDPDMRVAFLPVDVELADHLDAQVVSS